MKWLAIIVAGFVIFPIVQVGCVRMVNPPLTPLMLLRQAEAHFERHRPAPRAYHWIDLAQMPNAFLRCVLASEDQRFFQHHGFDWQEVEIARREALRKGTPPRGASTISMQCARSLFLWQGRSWIRKGLEAYYTFWMEAFLSKRRILELYGNVIEMGDGIYGLEAAAQFHYRVNGRALTREQAAMLAAILPNPREWDPTRPSAKLIARAVRILQMEPALKVPSLR
ncbi:MAG: monofunctional glycosyltransferase [Chthoniobacter sp.]|nr:monofunctional glycosyltransferase [Chthoniobacter sp.]